MKKVILGLGSNRNYNGLTSLQILSKACTSLSEILSFITLSSVYISKPMYYENQDEWYAKPGIELLQREVEQFKKKNHYEQLVKDLREDMTSRDSKQKILKNK